MCLCTPIFQNVECENCLTFANKKIAELQEEIKLSADHEFCYDLQTWIKSKLHDLDGFGRYSAYQNIRKAVYTSRVSNGNKPSWGNPDWYDAEYLDTTPLMYSYEKRKTRDLQAKLTKAVKALVSMHDTNPELVREVLTDIGESL